MIINPRQGWKKCQGKKGERTRGTWEPVVPRIRQKPKWRTHKGESTDAGHRGGPTLSSEEVP